jgi:hypothetical protein
VPRWSELAVKTIYPQVINTLPELHHYLPEPHGTAEDQRYPDRDFFYRVLYALYPDTVEDLVRQAAAAKKPPEKALQEEQWTMAIKPEWMDQLLLHDYTSCKFRPPTSLTPLLCRQERQGLEQRPDLEARKALQAAKAERGPG